MPISYYFEIILSLPEPVLKALIDSYNAGTITNPKTIMALEIIDGLSLED